MGILIDCLGPLRYSLDASSHLLLTRHELNSIICGDIYRKFIQVTWTNTQGGLHSKMAFYVEHIMIEPHPL